MKRYSYTLLLAIVTTLCSMQWVGAKEYPMTLSTPTGKINGTLSLPQKGRHLSVVLLIAGSGPTNRHGNNPQAETNNLKLIADTLASQGVASLRYDKRGIPNGTSVRTPESELRFENNVSDARGWIDLLAKDKRFSSIIVMGHSEGSLVGILACQDNPKVAGFVSLAGAGRPADEVFKEQLGSLMPDQKDEAFAVIDRLKAGDTLVECSPALAAMFRASVQPYMASWFKWDPKIELGKLNIPLLIVQGNTDIQVQVKDAELLHEAAPTAGYTIIAGMNHVLKKCELRDIKVQMATYMDPRLPLHPELVAAIMAFLNQKI